MGGVKKAQRSIFVSPRHQLRDGLETVAQVMALHADGMFGSLHRLYAALQGQTAAKRSDGALCRASASFWTLEKRDIKTE